MKYLAFLLFVLLGTAADAQQTFVVNPGQRIGDVVNVKDFYTYPAFGQGRVYFHDGSSASAPMNYNALYGEIQFINPKGDTLSLADEKKIRMITIDSDTFYIDHGYLRQVLRSGSLKLLSRDLLRQSSSAKIGLYDQPVNGGAASSYTVISSGARDANLVVNERVSFKREITYFFSDGKGHVLPASRKNAEKLSDKKEVLADYLERNDTDFKNEADLKKLIAYLQLH